MKKINSISTVVFILMLTVSFAIAQDKKPAKFGGVKTCKACHLAKKSGAQYKLWKKGSHASAFETLKSPAAQEIAKAKGLGDPSTEAACLKCHVTAHGVAAELIGPKYTMEEGVSCESCHGAGSKYKGRKVMKDIYTGKVDGATLGLIEPTEEVCVTCHNEESPTYKKFVYEERVKLIAHPTPKKTK